MLAEVQTYRKKDLFCFKNASASLFSYLNGPGQIKLKTVATLLGHLKFPGSVMQSFGDWLQKINGLVLTLGITTLKHIPKSIINWNAGDELESKTKLSKKKTSFEWNS